MTSVEQIPQKGRRRQTPPYYKALFTKLGIDIEVYDLVQVDEAGSPDTHRVYVINDTISCQEATVTRILPVIQEILDDHKTFVTCFGGESAFYKRLINRTEPTAQEKKAA